MSRLPQHPLEIVTPEVRLAGKLAEAERRVAELEQAFRVEPTRYIGDTGNPPFQNSWVHYDTVRRAGFYRHAGRVYLTGVAKSGASGSVMFTLPEGYRPIIGNSTDAGIVVVSAYTGPANFSFFATGAVVATNLGTSDVATFVFLEGVSFRHA